jgi:hypothetical protein
MPRQSSATPGAGFPSQKIAAAAPNSPILPQKQTRSRKGR